MGGWPGDRGPDRPGRGRRRAGLRPARRPLPARAAGALLPDPRLGPGRRGRAAGGPAGRLAGPERIRATCLDPDLAVPGRYQPLPARAAVRPAPPADRLAAARPRPPRADPAGRRAPAGSLPRPPPPPA